MSLAAIQDQAYGDIPEDGNQSPHMVIVGMAKNDNVYPPHPLPVQVSHHPLPHIISSPRSSVNKHIPPVRELQENGIALPDIEKGCLKNMLRLIEEGCPDKDSYEQEKQEQNSTFCRAREGTPRRREQVP